MSNAKLFVGNLSYNTTENDLQDAFAAHGTVVGNAIERLLLFDRGTHHINPAVSGKPQRMFMLCTAWPEAPLTMLSSALITSSRPVRGSRRQAISMVLVPMTFLVSGRALSSR